VGLRAGLDMCEISHPHRDSILGPSSPVSKNPQKILILCNYGGPLSNESCRGALSMPVSPTSVQCGADEDSSSGTLW
jgi:hypothetical protein